MWVRKRVPAATTRRERVEGEGVGVGEVGGENGHKVEAALHSAAPLRLSAPFLASTGRVPPPRPWRLLIPGRARPVVSVEINTIPILSY